MIWNSIYVAIVVKITIKTAIILTKKKDVYPSSLNLSAGSSTETEEDKISSILKLDLRKSNSANPKS